MQWLRLPPFMFRMVRVFGIVMYVVHIFTCGYWLIKVVSNDHEKMADWYVFLFCAYVHSFASMYVCITNKFIRIFNKLLEQLKISNKEEKINNCAYVHAFASMYVCANVRDWLAVLVLLWIKYTLPRRTHSRTWQPSVHEPVRVHRFLRDVCFHVCGRLVYGSPASPKP